jgi:hypothetical protein
MAAPEPGLFEKLKSGIAGVADTVASTGKKALGMDNSVALDSTKVPKAMGLPAEPAGMTITGGRRYRKKTAKRHSKKRKTMRRKH